MRDPKRIPIVLGEVELFWKQNPDLRLGQLLSILLKPNEDIFYIEDDVLLERIIKKYGE